MMNDSSKTIQLLIDGELDDNGRSELISWLDRENPQAWRDVSLGFIENQILSGAFRSLAPATAAVKPSPAPAYGKWTAGMAAALLIGIGTGWLLHPTGHPYDAANSPVAAATRASAETAAAGEPADPTPWRSKATRKKPPRP